MAGRPRVTRKVEPASPDLAGPSASRAGWVDVSHGDVVDLAEIHDFETANNRSAVVKIRIEDDPAR
ncbi:MAG: hypothetical protein ACHQ52_08120 [Candidatus Eisenbacteria bacterium]